MVFILLAGSLSCFPLELLGFRSLSGKAFAQIQYDVTVTATIADNAGPTTPILISPNNGSYVTDNTPGFVWKASTDANGMNKYVLTLDGNTLFDNIPTTPTDNAQYTLTYNGVSDEYTLVPKSVIADGIHTWKVRAVDNLNNGTDSATWTFTMDTQAPAFVITNFGELSVSISAQDSSTIPASPLILQNNSPLLVAHGEANSSVAVTLIIPGDPTQYFNTFIDGGGNWNLQLGILPRDVVMTLNFTITDLAGNVSVLNGVRFLIETGTIIIPTAPPSPTPVPSPTPGVSPTPDVTPSPPAPGASPSPLPPPSPIITIPVIPPQEIAYEITQELLELLPPGIALLVNALPEEVVQIIKDSAPISGLLVAAALPIASTIAIATQFGGGISLDIFAKILQALGLIPAGKPQGLVFNSRTFEPIPFALLTITNPATKQTPVIETVVTDVSGVYRGIKLPPDTYQITVSHQDYLFPSQVGRPQFVRFQDFYRGEPFQVQSNETEQLFLIPVDPINPNGKPSWRSRLRVALAQFGKLSGALMIPLFILSGFLALLFPSVWNWAVFILYALLVGYHALAWFKTPILTGTVIDETGNPVENTIIRLSISQSNQLHSVISTDQNGEFKINGPHERYELMVTKPGYVWVDQNSTLSLYEVDATTSSQNVVITLKAIGQLYSNLF